MFRNLSLLLRRFKELENYNGMTDNPKARGFHGPLDVRQAPIHPTVMAEKLALAIEQATGFKEILDYNNPNTPIGPFTRNQYTQKPNGTRESSSTAFLSENVVDEDGFGVNGRKLRVLTKSTALDIIFCDKDALENFIRQNLSLTFHEQSTLRMAPSPRDGVVNFQGEVFGVRNLVVADNSIIPFTAD